MLNILKKQARQKGDTIIEVMVALTVIGMSLGIAYAITNRSLATGRAAQERTEALKLAETQLEELKVYEQSIADLRDNTDDFCLYEGSRVLLSDTDSVCLGVNRSSLYSLQLLYTPPTATEKESFQSIVTWDLPNSIEEGRVILRYRP